MKTLGEPSQSLTASERLQILWSYQLNTRQQLVLRPENRANDIMYGGARGGGKSFLLRWIFSLFCAYAPGLLCYLFRRTYEELWQNHMEGDTSFPALLRDEISAGHCAIVGKQVRWANGSRIFLNHMQLEKHKYKYHGFEMHCLGVDQATDFSETQLRYVFSSVRLGHWRPPPPEEFPWASRLPFIMLGANPGGPSHDFIKSRYVDLGPNKIVTGDEPGQRGTSRQFLPARAEDNPELLRNDPLYLERLELLGDPVLVRAHKEGNWDFVAGAMFGDVWRAYKFLDDGEAYEWHVCDPLPIPVGWPLWRGGDDGFANPAAVYWATKNPDTDTIYIVDELYSAGLTAPELAERIKSKDLMLRVFLPAEKETVFNTEILTGDYDSNAFVQTGRTSEISRGEQMNRLGCRWKPVQKWPGSRVARIQHLHQLLKPNPKERGRRPGIVFFRGCTNAIRTIPKLMRDEDDREDIAEGQEDHGFDGVTYTVQHRRLKAGRVPVGF